jgi:hypothetical protein
MALGPLSAERDIYKVSGNGDSIAEFPNDFSHLTIAGVCWNVIFTLLTPNLEDLNWAIDSFKSLDKKVQELLEHQYRGCSGQESVTEIEWINSLCAGDFSLQDARGKACSHFYPGTSRQWHEMARSCNTGHLNGDRDDLSYIDVKITQILGGTEMLVSENGYCGLVLDHAENKHLVCVLFWMRCACHFEKGSRAVHLHYRKLYPWLD